MKISDEKSEKVVVVGICFDHDSNRRHEFYSYTDDRDLLWQVWRYLPASEPGIWYASLHQLKGEGFDLILRSGSDPMSLLEAMVELIELSGWLKDSSYPSKAPPTIFTSSIEGTQVELNIKCHDCGKTYCLKVEAADYLRYLNKTEVIQDIFPYIEPPLRELLVSGTCPRCWRVVFGGEATSEEDF